MAEVVSFVKDAERGEDIWACEMGQVGHFDILFDVEVVDLHVFLFLK